MRTKSYVIGACGLLMTILVAVEAVGFHGFHYKGLQEPHYIGPRSAELRHINQLLDHFNHRDNRTWSMRYYEESRYFNGSGPIFIMLGGEWEINSGFLQAGLMHDIGVKHGALMFYTEHRYYGKSIPTEDMSTESMQYLNVDQALADIAYFIEKQKSAYNVDNATVIVFGGSYAGNMAAWARIKYPHLIKGALASSAPVYAKEDFYEYYEVVTRSIERYDSNCTVEINSAFEYAEELLASKDGPETLKKLFNLCQAPDVKSKSDVGYFMNYLAELFASTVQYNSGVGRSSSIGSICEDMTNFTISHPLERLAGLLQKFEKCTDVSYSSFIKEMINSTAWSSAAIMRAWFFQTCTEYGYYQTTNSSKSVFGTLFNLDFFIDICTDIYGQYYGKNVLTAGVDRTNIMYGGKLPDITNVIFSNGDVDPWHALSVLEDLNESSPAILISGSSHCEDLYVDHSSDPPALTAARQRIREIIAKWLKH